MTGGGAASVGIGGSISKGATTTTPKDLIYDGPRVLRDLISLVKVSGACGLLLHINNRENLTAGDAARSAIEFPR